MVRKLKRLLAPDFWKIAKKEATWVVSPRPGPHKKFECIPLLIIVRNILGYAETGKEAKAIIKRGEIWVDGKPRKDHAYPAGLFDVISIPKVGEHYRISASKKGLKLIKIDEKEAKVKICKIRNKTVVKKGKIQLNLHDGKNILIEKDKDKFKTGDSVLISLPDLKIKKHLPLEKGFLVLVIKGKNAGKIGKVLDVIPGKFNIKPKVIVEIEGKKGEVLKEYIYVIGKEKPEIKVIE
ncbi:MAG: 30S ribosomal protein S4e [Candidatus Aenigmarchaeota archaeon]|nr:30S ribosomal protein S4e [Candidatus Aenigmarchaeota archaeon]